MRLLLGLLLVGFGFCAVAEETLDSELSLGANHVILKWDKKYCTFSRGNLFIRLGDEQKPEEGLLKIRVYNYRTIFENLVGVKQTTEINMRHSSIGTVSLNQFVGSRPVLTDTELEIEPSVLPDAKCQMTLTRTGDSIPHSLAISMKCKDLTSRKIPLPEERAKRPYSFKFSNLQCEVQKDNVLDN